VLPASIALCPSRSATLHSEASNPPQSWPTREQKTKQDSCRHTASWLVAYMQRCGGFFPFPPLPPSPSPPRAEERTSNTRQGLDRVRTIQGPRTSSSPYRASEKRRTRVRHLHRWPRIQEQVDDTPARVVSRTGPVGGARTRTDGREWLVTHGGRRELGAGRAGTHCTCVGGITYSPATCGLVLLAWPGGLPYAAILSSVGGCAGCSTAVVGSRAISCTNGS